MFIASQSFLLLKLRRSAIDSSLTSALLQRFASERHHAYELVTINISLLWSENRLLLRVYSQIPHQKRIDISGLLDRFRRVAGPVA